ncbi:complex I subunit 5 family protein [Nesterenkonia lacusekhoensis]|uniref:Formate hydrogenlyase subunit 3/multisubunit Na+/H+ antiporter MnhD subunit n=1 Tax=Nesterenkonia lacusekhoensis TaxID=150832 RepID=A0ABS4T4B4_9MICC|nr:proton-conducting transporter membrane subunit [Nesterenkonia lacusekhoensis]MBP2319297.1 formate hydrogenlyase subunit 3/multisubunit Na+/H+ antiporter MnhD subunit [Nesterenkonia lacusekhoensis]
MSAAEFSLGGLVLLPLLASAAAVLLGGRARGVVGLLTALLICGLCAPVLAQAVAGSVTVLPLGGYEAPLGIRLRADGLSVLFLCLAAAVGTVVSLHAAIMPASTGQRLVSSAGKAHAEQADAGRADSPAVWQSSHPGFWPLWLGCWSGLNAVFVSGDLFNTYVGLELVGLTAVALVALGGRDSWMPALRYLFVAVLGSLLFLVGVGLILAATGTLDMEQAAQQLAETPESHAAAVFALCLMSVGLGLKVALMPMHRWLIPAHAGAPGAVSPLLSALVIKAALFVILRLWLWVMPWGVDPSPAVTALAWMLGGMGALAVILGSVMALRQDRLKPLVAYSTVAQVGYWFLFLPLLLDPEADALEGQPGTTLAEDSVLSGALSGSVALALGHGVAKAGLFLAAGLLKELWGTDEIDSLRGAGRKHPLLIMAMGLCAVGLIGLPVSLGFTGKWHLATSAVAAEHWWIVAVLVLGTLLSAGYLLRAIAPLLLQDAEDPQVEHDAGPQPHEAAAAAESPRRHRLAEVPPFLLGLLTVLTGFLGVGLDALIGVGAPW